MMKILKMFKTPILGAFFSKVGQIRISKKTGPRHFPTITKLDFMQRIKKDTELEANAFLCTKLRRDDEQDLIY